jgi:SAM-dependent methyltransferase
MEQIVLFSSQQSSKNLQTFISRLDDSTLCIPEGLHTIPCTHGLHRFAGKFIPNIPRFILRTVIPSGSGRVILDPFCGSGTTLVEAALDGKEFIGMDIDPLSVAISTAKTQTLSEADISDLEKFWASHDYHTRCPQFIPSVPNINHWFTDTALIQLSSIKARCMTMPKKLQLFSLIVFSSIIRRVSNADDQTQKTYVSHTLPKKPPLAITLFPIFLQRAISGMREYTSLLPREPKGKIILGDARFDLNGIAFDDVITSPPYIDSIDYIYNQMLEYYWLLDEVGIGSHDKYRELRKKPMGFKTYDESMLHAFSKEYIPDISSKFEEICSLVGAVSPKEELVVRSFFLDYAKHVQAIHLQQQKGNFYVCVIGNSFIRGTTIPSAEIIESIHRNVGYKLNDKLSYEIRRHYMKFPRRSNSGKIKQDYILIFEVP